MTCFLLQNKRKPYCFSIFLSIHWKSVGSKLFVLDPIAFHCMNSWNILQNIFIGIPQRKVTHVWNDMRMSTYYRIFIFHSFRLISWLFVQKSQWLAACFAHHFCLDVSNSALNIAYPVLPVLPITSCPSFSCLFNKEATHHYKTILWVTAVNEQCRSVWRWHVLNRRLPCSTEDW